jgi:hypothetical protein
MRLQRGARRYEAALQEGEIAMSPATTPFSPEGPARTAGLGRRRESPRPRRVIGAVIAAGAVCMALAVQAPTAGALTTLTTPTPDAGIVPFAGDVYTASANGTLIPVLPDSAPASTPLYNLAGNALNVTWGQWSSATAKSLASTFTLRGVTYTGLLIGMNGLVPNGVYSLFYQTFGPNSANPVCGAVDLDPLVALTAAFPRLQRPDPDSFVASSSGKGLFLASVPGNLLAAQILEIVLIYHFDGHTYGPVPNAGEAGNDCTSSYGIDAMRQMIIIQKGA